MGRPIPPGEPGTCYGCCLLLPASLSIIVYLPAESWIGDPPNPLPMTIGGTLLQWPVQKCWYSGLYPWNGRFGGVFEVRFCEPENYNTYIVFTSIDVEVSEERIYGNHCSIPAWAYAVPLPAHYTVVL